MRSAGERSAATIAKLRKLLSDAHRRGSAYRDVDRLSPILGHACFYGVPPNEPIIYRRSSSGGSKTPVRSAEAIYVGNFFRRQNASGGRIRRSISIMGRGESGWKEGVEEIIRKSCRTPTVERFLIANLLHPKKTCRILDFCLFEHLSSQLRECLRIQFMWPVVAREGDRRIATPQ
jgi:hypothetical protein